MRGGQAAPAVGRYIAPHAKPAENQETRRTETSVPGHVPCKNKGRHTGRHSVPEAARYPLHNSAERWAALLPNRCNHHVADWPGTARGAGFSGRLRLYFGRVMIRSDRNLDGICHLAEIAVQSEAPRGTLDIPLLLYSLLPCPSLYLFLPCPSRPLLPPSTPFIRFHPSLPSFHLF